MLTFRYTPATFPATGPILERIEAMLEGQVVAWLDWHMTPSAPDVAQVLGCEVDPAYRRRGVASALVREMIQRFRTVASDRKAKPRRVWLALEQKRQLHARALMSKLGFHHVGTAKNVLHDQDQMIYTLALD